jgi:hypothetical protein
MITSIHSISHRIILVGLALGMLIATIGSATVAAIPAISQNYNTSSMIPVGGIVSLKDGSFNEVAAASPQSVDNILGVAINASTALIALTGNAETDVQVATSGIVEVLVSDINGEVIKGDQITASPISGVGMKATSNVRVVGVAQQALTTEGSQIQTVEGVDGQTREVRLGRIPVLINVSYFFKESERSIIPAVIQNVANALAGRPVSTLPIILAGAIFIIMLIVVVSIIYSMIRSSIISVGRNPLSQSAIYRDLIQLSALVIGILAVGLIAIYLILTRL